jgi:hypothetical protein
MRVGLLSESDYDTIVLTELVKKIAAGLEPAPVLEFAQPYEVGGTILTKMDAAATLFFTPKQHVVLAVFGVDMDGKRARKLTVTNFITSTEAQTPDRYIAALFIEPHLEALFFAEGGNALKAVLNRLDATQPIPYANMGDTKERLAKLITEFGSRDLSITKKDVYSEITRALDLDQLANNHPDFRRFREKVLRICRSNPLAGA